MSTDVSPFTVADLAFVAPVSPGIAQAVWQAHEENVERMKQTQIPHELRGELRWNVSLLGLEFKPGEGADAAIMDLITAGQLGGQVKLTFTL